MENDKKRTFQPLLAFEPLRELIRELVGFKPEQAERNMKRLEECMKRKDAKVVSSALDIPSRKADIEAAYSRLDSIALPKPQISIVLRKSDNAGSPTPSSDAQQGTS